MTPFHSLFLVLNLCLTALGQQITLSTPPSILQCADVPISWSGGVSPFFLTIATTDNASTSSVEAVPSVDKSPYTWNADLPGGTPFTIFVRDDNDNSVESPTLTVQNSTNSSCLDEGDTPPPSTHTGHSSKALPTDSQTFTTPPSATGSSTSKGSPSNVSHVAIIAGVIVGVLILLALIVVLMMLQRRRDRRHHTSSKEQLVRTFGNTKADLDGMAEDEAEAMAIPEPYVYGSVSRAQTTNLASIDTEESSRSPTATRPSPARRSNNSPETPASRKGERYLPNFATSPQGTSPGGASPGSRMPEEDIDRLAARMVAMMSAGRLADQAWVPGRQGPVDRDMELEDSVSGPPPLYKDVARRSRSHPNSGRS